MDTTDTSQTVAYVIWDRKVHGPVADPYASRDEARVIVETFGGDLRKFVRRADQQHRV